MANALEPLPNNGSQLERAVGAWLVDATSANDPGFKILADWIYFLNDSRDREPKPNERTPIITILAATFEPSVKFTGNREWMLTIETKFAARGEVQPANPMLNRVFIDRIVGLVEAAMARYTEGSRKLDVTRDGITVSGRALATAGTAIQKSNNADMAQFTCLFVGDVTNGRRGHPTAGGETDSGWWIEPRTWPITACPSLII